MESLRDFANMSNRDKAILVGLFLSKFNNDALNAFDFSGYKQAYNVLGYSLGVQPNSINNYRDEFDPYFPNGRKGWHNRPLRDYCKDIMDRAAHLSYEQFVFIINSYISKNELILEDVKHPHLENKHEFTAERLITGKAAEEYFVQRYETIDVFKGFQLTDTTNLGCGFDFRLTDGSANYYIEVKGMNNKSGNILMTEKEHRMAEELLNKYCLFVVKDFRQRPFHEYYFDPINAGSILFEKQERHITQTTYTGKFISL